MTQYQKCKDEVLKLTPSLRSDFLRWLRAEVKRETQAPDALKQAGKRALDAMAEVIGGPVLLTSRIRLYMYARTVIADWLIGQGWTTTQAGQILKKDHSTITALLRNARSYDALPLIYYDYIDMRDKFQKIMARDDG